ncbi:MAG: hypothetical protein ABSC20_04215 [Candidatus Bathyarchaeia archaeon]
MTTQILSDKFKWSSRAVRTALNSLNIAQKGLPSTIKIAGKSNRVIFFESDKIEKRLREFVPDYTPNELNGKKSVTLDTEVTLSRCGGKQIEGQATLFDPHLKSVSSVPSVTLEKNEDRDFSDDDPHGEDS